ncbi:MAG TPA: Do family serine endopeptidase [Terriglobia bacterium]|nr:Do family serine endopeptidase [Terriglobia bacterium]
MTQKRLLYLTLIIATLTIGVVIGTIVSGGVKATGELQKSAALVIPDPVSLSNAFSQIAANLDPAVVNINTEATVETPVRGRNNQRDRNNVDPFDLFDFFGGTPDAPDRKARNLGTGFVVDKAGYILTNHHVVDKATKIMVRLDDKSEHQAKLIGSDSETDLAVIKIDVNRDLPVARLGNSDAVKVGDWVLAIGSPFSLDHTVTAGIISAKGRQNIAGTSNQFQSFLQTDAAINPGNSGGPLVNMAGEVIGINTAIISETRQSAGLGFALPSNTAAKVYNQIVMSGKVTRGGIGVGYNEDPALCRAFGLKSDCGVVVQNVLEGGPAAKAGIQPGDVITEINGTKITGGTVLLDVVANASVGSTLRAKINREGKEQTVSIAVVDRAEVVSGRATNEVPDNNDQSETAQERLGIRVQPITPELARQLRLDSAEGVIISSVDSGSIGEDAGLAPRMIITRIIAGNQKVDIRNVDDFRRAERLLKSGTDVAFMIMQRNPTTNRYQSGFLAVTIP